MKWDEPEEVGHSQPAENAPTRFGVREFGRLPKAIVCSLVNDRPRHPSDFIKGTDKLSLPQRRQAYLGQQLAKLGRRVQHTQRGIDSHDRQQAFLAGDGSA